MIDNDNDNELTIFDSNYENSVPEQEPSQLNSYFKKNVTHSAFKKKSSAIETAKQFSSTYLEFLDAVNFPHLYKFFTSQNNFYCKDFYQFATKNFINLNEEELEFISHYLVPENFKTDIFNYVLHSSDNITLSQFKSLLSQPLDNSFNNIYLTHMMTKYAFSHFDTIDEQEQNLLWSKIDLSLSKHNFLHTAVEHGIKIPSQHFFSTFKHEFTEDMSSYFKLAVDNKWTENIIYFSKYLSKIPHAYLNSLEELKTQNEIDFECLFLYYHPNTIKESHLDDEHLDLVFKKIYEYTPHKNFFNHTNVDFLNSLGFGLYKFLEIAYQHSPHAIEDFLVKENNQLFKSFSVDKLWLQRQSMIYTLLEYADDLPDYLQKSFKDNLVVHFKEFIFSDKEFLNSVIHNSSHDSFIYQFVAQNNELPNHEMNAFIYGLMNDFVIASNNTESSFAEKINSFDYKILKDFEPHLEFSLSIFRNQYRVNEYPQRDFLLDTIKKTFTNIVLHKKLDEKLVSTDIKKEKKLKI